MNQIPDKSIDMVLCDLPYGVTQNKLDIPIPFENLWSHYDRIVKDNGAILLFAQGLFYVNLVVSNVKMFRYDIVWDKELKTGFLNANRAPLRKHEQIAVFYKKQPTYNPQYEEGNPLHSKGVNYKNKEIKNNNYGKFNPTDDARKGSTMKYPSSIVKFAKPHPSAALHRTEKPIELLRYLIRTYSNEGNMVLDNTAGSGGVGVACLMENRKFILMENDYSCYILCNERCKTSLKE